MKKTASLLLAMLLALTLCIGASSEEAAPAGTWALTDMTIGGMSIAADTLGVSLTLALNEDGSCTLTANGRSETGSWAATEAGVIVTDATGTANELTLQDGALIMTRGDATLAFAPAAAAGNALTVRSGLTVADFNGLWKLHHLEMAQGYILQKDMGVDMTITLQDGQGKVVMVSGSSTTTYACECEVREYDGLGSAMICWFLDPATALRDGSGISLLLFSNGQLVWHTSDSMGDYYYCFQPAQAQ